MLTSACWVVGSPGYFHQCVSELIVSTNEQELGELDFLLRVAAMRLCENPKPEPFLNWIADAGPLLLKDLSAEVRPDAGPAGDFFRALGVQIYNHMPLPAHGWRPSPLPRPQRNEPCHCGSGRKYKHCCLALESMGSPVAGLNLLRYVLGGYPKRALAELPGSQVDTEALADVAMHWLEQGEASRALALLEPWFKPDIVLGRRQVPLFDILMGIYLELDKPLKRKRLLERACASGERQLRAEAWQCKASIEMDKGDTEAAWGCFALAQKADPDSPALALLEITLLCADGQLQQARARAVFWLARFRRQGNASRELLELLAQCAEDPQQALFESLSEADGLYADLQQLLAMLATAPAPQPCYRIELIDNEAMLTPQPALAALEERWQKVAASSKPMLTCVQNDDMGFWQRSAAWLPVLQANPSLWNSLDVLDDLVMGVDTLLAEGSVLDGRLADLLDQLLARAEQLLECQLARLPAAQRWTLPWLMQENRPALRLLAHGFFLAAQCSGSDAEVVRRGERLLRLNPEDNHGVRGALSSAYLEQQRLDEVLALTARYPHDATCILPLNRLLALYLMGRQSEAVNYLQAIACDFKVALDMLLAKSPRKPAVSEYGITLGGKDEAWLYREQALALWKASGGLTWLRRVRS